MNHRYVIVSPVKDEAKYIESTIESVVMQSEKPKTWVIVDDGSVDQTTQIVEKYIAEHSWIKLLRINRGNRRYPGSAVVRAFSHGYEYVRKDAFDFIVKLDCDLRFSSTYFEQLLAKFDVDPKLGIASGEYLEPLGKDWVPVKMPKYHAAGASKVIRHPCFEEIGGFIQSRGWDTVDEIRAQMLGWKTTHFSNISFFHLKPEGSGIGNLRTNVMHGEIFYLTGGGILFLTLKTGHRFVFGKPPIVSGLAMFLGYLRSLLMRQPKLVSKKEAYFYRKSLNSRVINLLKAFIGVKCH